MRTMSDSTERADDLQRIAECMERQAEALEQNRDAILLLDARIDSHGLYLKGILELMQMLARRQSELEVASEKRKLNCAETMQSLMDRITALENDKTPLPQKFTRGELESMCPSRLSAGRVGGNGFGETRLSLSAPAADDETISDEDNGDIEP